MFRFNNHGYVTDHFKQGASHSSWTTQFVILSRMASTLKAVYSVRIIPLERIADDFLDR